MVQDLKYPREWLERVPAVVFAYLVPGEIRIILHPADLKGSGVFFPDNEACGRLILIVCQDACVALAVVTPIMSSTGHWGGLQRWA